MKAKLIFYSTMIAIYTGIVIINKTIASFSGRSTTSFPILESFFEALLICLFVCPFSCSFARHYTGSAWHGVLALLLFLIIPGYIFIWYDVLGLLLLFIIIVGGIITVLLYRKANK